MVDEFVVANSDASAQYNELSGGSVHYVLLNDPPGAPVDTDYTENNDEANANEELGYPSFVITGATSINALCLFVRISEPLSSTGQGRQNYFVDGVRFNVTTRNPSSTLTTFEDTVTDNGATATTWTIDEIKGIDATNPYDDRNGVRALTGAGEAIRCSQQYSCCDYEVAAAGNPWYFYAQQ
jgi:hypothetical protein